MRSEAELRAGDPPRLLRFASRKACPLDPSRASQSTNTMSNVVIRASAIGFLVTASQVGSSRIWRTAAHN